MATSSNIKLSPFEYGVLMAKSGQEYYTPYDCADNTVEYRKGFYSATLNIHACKTVMGSGSLRNVLIEGTITKPNH